MSEQMLRELMAWASMAPPEQIIEGAATLISLILSASGAVCGQEFLIKALETGNSAYVAIPCIGRPM